MDPSERVMNDSYLPGIAPNDHKGAYSFFSQEENSKRKLCEKKKEKERNGMEIN